MGSYEFSLHLALEREEGTGAHHWPQLWACLMAAVHNGPLVKSGKQLWQPTDFKVPSWSPPAPKAATENPASFVNQISAAGTPRRHPKR